MAVRDGFGGGDWPAGQPPKARLKGQPSVDHVCNGKSFGFANWTTRWERMPRAARKVVANNPVEWCDVIRDQPPVRKRRH